MAPFAVSKPPDRQLHAVIRQLHRYDDAEEEEMRNTFIQVHLPSQVHIYHYRHWYLICLQV